MDPEAVFSMCQHSYGCYFRTVGIYIIMVQVCGIKTGGGSVRVISEIALPWIINMESAVTADPRSQKVGVQIMRFLSPDQLYPVYVVWFSYADLVICV